MSDNNNAFELNCAVLVDGRYRGFRAPALPNMSITALVPEIVRAYEQISHGDTLGPFAALYKVDVTRKELANIGAPSEDDELDGIDLVGDYWPDPRQLNTRNVHILVMANAVSLIQPPPPQVGAGTVSQVTSALEQLTLRQENMARAFREAPSASVAARHAEFERQQAKDVIPIYNGRPFERTDIPIQLFHPVFNMFTTHLEETDELTAMLYRTTENFLFDSQAIYKSETDRWSAIEGLLTAAIGHPIHKDNVSKCHSTGVITFTEDYSDSKAYGAIIELKNEVGTGHSDPWIQGAQSFARYWSQMTRLREATRCPSIIISIAGPWMCISGAVYLDHVLLAPQSLLCDNYAPFIRAGSNPSIDPYRFFPYIKSVQTSDGEVSFRYKDTLGRPGVVQPIFEAVTADGRAVVVKFAQFYNFEAHQLLAAHSLAPKLLSVRADPAGRGLVMIVMELSGKSLDNYLAPLGPGLKPKLRDQVYNDVKRTLDLLHANNIVFGDLRSPNVLVTEAANGSLSAQLVDFEWCGIEGEARYPVGMNESIGIRWAAGAEKNGLIAKEHDRDMLEKLFLPPPNLGQRSDVL